MRYELVWRGFKKQSKDIKYLQRCAARIEAPWEIHMLVRSKMKLKSFDRFSDMVMEMILGELSRGHTAQNLCKKYMCTPEHLNQQIRIYKQHIENENTLQLP